MNFEIFFRLVSYAAVFCGFLALCVSETFGVIETGLFVAVMVAAWFLEDSRWQISERVGTALILLALPVFYLAWDLKIITPTGGETWIAGVLARMILSLAAIKLLQKKSDRDWIFLYLMSFFEVLLAAGLSISPLYFGAFLLYLLVIVCAVIAFEIRKTSRAVGNKLAGLQPDKKSLDSKADTALPVRRMPVTAIVLIVFIVLIALPLFFMLPRVGGAGFGGNQKGQEIFSGFSDSVRLGNIGRIQRNDEIVMRVKLDGNAEKDAGLYFRGVALDTFDNRTWSKSKSGKESFVRIESDPIRLDYASNRENVSIQTIYLEPLDTPILFGLPKIVEIQGNFPILDRDAYGAVSYPRAYERISYKVLSDRGLPTAVQLRADDWPYTTDVQSYRDLPPKYDLRIAELASQIGSDSKNRYDKARSIESHLQNSYGYTLELKASGSEPLSDFLFNVREGHCEYFATAMAVMLRTQGIATRIVNGFHGGEYNDAAGVTVVRQRNAHAWVEVYFPKENVWVPFDPTPVAGQGGVASPTGIAGTINKYIEALETFWIQYFVAFDNQEQRSLVRSIRNSLVDYQGTLSSYSDSVQSVLAQWWTEVRGDKGLAASLMAIAYGVGYFAATVLGVLFIFWVYRRIGRLKIWSLLWNRLLRNRHGSIVGFYDRMQRILATKGVIRQSHETPLEFAFSLRMPEAVKITEKYNRVRFGERDLSRDEENEIETWLQKLKAPEKR